MSATRAKPSAAADPYNVERFAVKQREDHARALRELRNGRKAGCWSWWVFPTPPFIRNGMRVGSPINQIYELADDAEGRAYLEHGDLRANYLAIVGAMNASLESGVAPRRLLGIDVPRAEASVRYFAHLATLASDDELGALCTRAQPLLKGQAPAGGEISPPKRAKKASGIAAFFGAGPAASERARSAPPPAAEAAATEQATATEEPPSTTGGEAVATGPPATAEGEAATTQALPQEDEAGAAMATASEPEAAPAEPAPVAVV